MSTVAPTRFAQMCAEALQDPEAFWGRVAGELPPGYRVDPGPIRVALGILAATLYKLFLSIPHGLQNEGAIQL